MATNLDKVTQLLENGHYKLAISILEDWTRTQPPDVNVYFKLGLARSETEQYPEAVIALKRAVELAPRFSEAWVAIGVAYIKMGRHADAKAALEEALRIKPSDGLALQNLSVALLYLGEREKAADTARLAMASQPPNERALWGVAEAVRAWSEDPLAESQREWLQSEATDAYKLFIKRYPNSPMVERAEQELTRMASARLRANSVHGFRPDVFEYIVEALKLFDRLGEQARNQVVMEAAQIGAGGVDINNPSDRYKLESLKGKIPDGRDFSALNIVSIMYTGMKQIAPHVDSGVDFSLEYDAAMKHLGRA